MLHNFTLNRKVLCSGVLLLLGLTTVIASANALTDMLGLGSDSGKIAKYEFQLKDSFPVTSLVWSPDGKYIATASAQGNGLHVWDVEQRKLMKTLTDHGSAYFHSLAWSPNGKYLASCDVTIVQVKDHRRGRTFLRLIDTHTWQDTYRLDPNDKQSGCTGKIAFSSDSKQVASIGRNLSVYSTADGHLIKTSELMNGWASGKMINAMAYVPGTYTLLIGGSEFVYNTNLPKTVAPTVGVVWELTAEETSPTQHWVAYHMDSHGLASDVVSLAVSPDGKQVATGARTGSGFNSQELITDSVHLFRLPDHVLLGTPLDGLRRSDGLPAFGIQSGLAYTPDGHYLIVGHEENVTKAIHIIDTKTFKVVGVVHASGPVYDVATNPKGSQFAVGTGDGIFVWSLPAQ